MSSHNLGPTGLHTASIPANQRAIGILYVITLLSALCSTPAACHAPQRAICPSQNTFHCSALRCVMHKGATTPYTLRDLPNLVMIMSAICSSRYVACPTAEIACSTAFEHNLHRYPHAVQVPRGSLPRTVALLSRYITLPRY